jgi:hypothetical protein
MVTTQLGFFFSGRIENRFVELMQGIDCVSCCKEEELPASAFLFEMLRSFKDPWMGGE